MLPSRPNDTNQIIFFFSVVLLTFALSSSFSSVIPQFLVCCNGAIPVFEHSSTEFREELRFQIDSESSGNNQCVSYRLISSISDLKEVSIDRSIKCQCSTGYSGLRCEYRRDSNVDSSNEEATDRTAALYDSSNTGSFKIFLLIAIIPLSFALVAGLGAFLCRMCFCDCFAIFDPCKRCWSKDPDNLETREDLANEELMDRQNAALRRQVSIDLHQHYHPAPPVVIPDAPHPNGRSLCHDPPPTFDAAINHPQQQIISSHNPISDPHTVISMQPKPDTFKSGANVARKYSPPPPYSPVANENSLMVNSDAATQTCGDVRIV